MEYIKNFLASIKGSIINLFLGMVAIVAVVFISKIILAIISKLTKRTIDKAATLEARKAKELKTSMTMTRSAARYLVSVLGLVFLLNLFGYDTSVSNFLLTAGIGGLILSLGAQSFVKDLLSGISIIFEKQYEVGDYVKIADQEGEVTAISLRSTYLDFRGQKIIIPNGQVDKVVNFNDRYNVFRFTVPTAYEADTKKVIVELEKILEEFYQKNETIFVEPPKVLGVDEFASSSVNILVQGKCRTLKHFQAERDLKLFIKDCFDAKKIEMPYQKVVIKK